MVPSRDYFGSSQKKIEEIRVVCKPCTILMDQAGEGQEWHNLWELLWMKEHTLRYLGHMISTLISDEPTISWSSGAVDSMFQLAALAHPGLMESDLPTRSIIPAVSRSRKKRCTDVRGQFHF
jgi:hypothetical protein